MSEEELDPYTTWIVRCHNIARELGEQCAKLRSIRPEPHERELQHVMVSLMTELWDRDYSQTEIRAAYLAALEHMPRYAAGSESRSAEARSQNEAKTIGDD
jgi:hypothetical protein